MNTVTPTPDRWETTHYDWPAAPGHAERPRWTGRGFCVGKEMKAVLSYDIAPSGWSDGLTTFHEEHAGSDHCIDRASRRHALAQLARHIDAPRPVLLEIGCSSGFFLEGLIDAWPDARVIGADYVRRPLEALAARRGDIPLLQFDLTRCPLPSDSIDGAVLLNVLEHIEDDAAAVRHICRILKPGGVAVIEVPAGPHLYDVYDQVLLHHRRYRLRDLCNLLRRAGLTISFASYLGMLVYPAFWWVKRRNQRYLSAPAEIQQQLVAQAMRQSRRSRFMESLFRLEDQLRRWLPFPFGIRCVATCVKGSSPASAAATRRHGQLHHTKHTVAEAA